MKKITAWFIALILMLGLAGCCGAAPEITTDSDGLFSATENESSDLNLLHVGTNVSPTYGESEAASADILNSFSTFLDREKFVAEISQEELKHNLNGHRYGNLWGYDDLTFLFSDGLGSSETIGQNEFFGYTIKSFTEPDLQQYHISQEFYTKVPMTNLTLPKGLIFDDPLASVFQKLGLDKDPAKTFPETGEVFPLLKNESATLKWIGCEKTAFVPYTSELQYEQIYQRTRSDGKTQTVTRRVTISFSDEENTLSRISLYINQSAPF